MISPLAKGDLIIRPTRFANRAIPVPSAGPRFALPRMTAGTLKATGQVGDAPDRRPAPVQRTVSVPSGHWRYGQ